MQEQYVSCYLTRIDSEDWTLQRYTKLSTCSTVVSTIGSVILLNAHSLHTVETCDLAIRPTPIHSTSKTPDLCESHWIANPCLGGGWGVPDPRTPWTPPCLIWVSAWLLDNKSNDYWTWLCLTVHWRVLCANWPNRLKALTTASCPNYRATKVYLTTS